MSLLSSAVSSSFSRRGTLPAKRMVALACAMAAAGLAHAQTPLSQLMVQGRQSAQLAVPDETRLSGQVRVIVQFSEPAVVDARPVSADRVSAQARAEMQQMSRSLQVAKAPRLNAIRSLGGRVQNTLEFSVNAAVVDIDAGQIEALRRIPGVKQVEPAGIYRMSQSVPTVPQLIGTLPVNQGGNGGQGVAIAVIDSGVDYTHASFDGPGTRAYYLTAVAGAGPTTLGDTPGVFPSGTRVKGGYDWLGETWNGSTALAVVPDPDPIDNKQVATDFAGHGTESASAAAGSAVPAGGLQPGSAPQAMILAYRGCSRLSSACEGSALLNSIDSVVKYALGLPNEGQPGAQNPALPEGTRYVLNMSLGSGFGNPLTNSLSEATRNAVRAGITVVASAGNANNIPFIVGTPSATDTVISVAASEPAGIIGGQVTVGAPLNTAYNALLAAYGPLPSTLTAPLAFAGPNNTAANTVNLACSAAPNNLPNPGPASPEIPALGGAIGLADRGTCEFNEKTVNVQRAGGSAMLLLNNQAGTILPGAGAAAALTTIPTFSLTQVDGAAIKSALLSTPNLSGTMQVAQLANVVGGVNVVDLISGFSSRGPSQAGRALKPDITAPGSTIWMADVGTGSGGNNSSGTSFSGPLTAGAAALVLSAKPSLAPWQVKAALMNTTDTDVFATKTAGGTTLATLTRMGAGRVRADRAVATGTLAYDAQNVEVNGGPYFNTAVSFGPQAFATPGTSSVSRTITVQNLDATPKTYNISVAARFADDLARGMTFTSSTNTLTVPANSTGSFQLVGTANSAALPTTAGGFPVKLTNLDTCTTTANPPAPVAACTSKFDQLEQDGFVTISAGANDTVRVPYLMYPRQASSVAVGAGAAAIALRNGGAAQTVVDVFHLLGREDAEDQPALVPGANVLPVDLRAVGVRYRPNAVPVPPAAVSSGDVIDFAVTLWKPVTTLRSAIFNIEIDTNGDGTTDFTVRNLNTTENRSSNFIVPAATGTPGNAFFFTDFALDSTKAILSVYPSVMGITANSRIGVRVTSSNSNGGSVLDRLPNNSAFQYITLSQPAVTPAGTSLVMPGSSAAQLAFTVNTAAAASTVSPGNKGLLLLMAENPVQNESAVLQILR
jgi:minor extracellular serine protease Vpr